MRFIIFMAELRNYFLMRKKMLFALTVSLSVGFLISCTKTCDNAYEGKQCNVPVNLKFAGVYAMNDTAVINSATDRRSYSLTVIAASTGPGNIALEDFGGTDSTLNGVANGSSFTIATDTIGQNQIINTSGALSGNTLSFSYMVVTGIDTVSRYASGMKAP
jgi:hypothetical protein